MRWTEQEKKLIFNGMNSIVEALNPSSRHFRQDLVTTMPNNHWRNGDSAVGYCGIVAKHDGIRRGQYNEDGTPKTSTRRVFDIIYAISEFRKVFKSFSDRETVRRMLGATRYDLPSTSSLLTVEDIFAL